MRIVDPVVLNPLRSEWESVKQKITLTLSALPEPAKLNSLIPAVRNAARRAASEPLRQAKQLQLAFLDRIRQVTILDPACGSGNFLYLSLLGLKDLEHQVNIESEQLGLEPVFPMVGPEVVHGIEINPYAAELARVAREPDVVPSDFISDAMQTL